MHEGTYHLHTDHTVVVISTCVAGQKIPQTKTKTKTWFQSRHSEPIQAQHFHSIWDCIGIVCDCLAEPQSIIWAGPMGPVIVADVL